MLRPDYGHRRIVQFSLFQRLGIREVDMRISLGLAALLVCVQPDQVGLVRPAQKFDYFSVGLRRLNSANKGVEMLWGEQEGPYIKVVSLEQLNQLLPCHIVRDVADIGHIVALLLLGGRPVSARRCRGWVQRLLHGRGLALLHLGSRIRKVTLRAPLREK